MNVLLIGSGGREHALAWKLAQSPKLGQLYAAPGNPGIARHAECVALDVSDHPAVVEFCRSHAIGLVVVGPEGPLVNGIADILRTAGIAVFGPGRDAARLEGSKAFTKALCAAHGIPTAAYAVATDAATARRSARTFGFPVVIKMDGLAAGKGVVIAKDEAEADLALSAMFAGDVTQVVIEEFLEGEEASLFVLCDGRTVVPLGSAQDHKRVGDGDTGPNTGGMGACSPTSALTQKDESRAMAEIVAPTVRALTDVGSPFVGVLFAGLMLTATGPTLIEYNVRFGDPEAQVLLPRYDGDLLQLFHAVATGTLDTIAAPVLSPRSAIAVVVAADGYPEAPRTGSVIGGLAAAENTRALIFQAGTKLDEGRLMTSGGRVLAVTATADTFDEARQIAYDGVAKIDIEGSFYRHDIGWRQGTPGAGEA